MPPAIQKLSEIVTSGQVSVKYFLRASTTAQRSVCFTADYSVHDSEEQSSKMFRCFLTETLHLETVEPFVVGSEILSSPRQMSLESAYTDEPVNLSLLTMTKPFT